jgi:hypothetical protein
MKVTKLADGLGWPEGPSPLADGRLIFVETYRSQVSVYEEGRGVSQFAYVGGGPRRISAPLASSASRRRERSRSWQRKSTGTGFAHRTTSPSGRMVCCISLIPAAPSIPSIGRIGHAYSP